MHCFFLQTSYSSGNFRFFRWNKHMTIISPSKRSVVCVYILSESKASERALAWRSALELLGRSVGIEALNTQLVETFWVLQSYPPGNELTISHQTGFSARKIIGSEVPAMARGDMWWSFSAKGLHWVWGQVHRVCMHNKYKLVIWFTIYNVSTKA